MLLVISAAMLTVVPLYVLSRAEERGNGCLREIMETGLGAPEACGPAPWERAFLGRLPWFAPDAARLASDTQSRAATLAYGQATAIAPQADARARAATLLLAERRHLVLAPAAIDPLGLLDGAFSEVVTAATESDDKVLRAFAFPSARALASLDALRTLATGGDASDPSLLNLRRGTTLCLLDASELGVETLAAADVAHRQSSKTGDGLDAARVAMLACGRAAPERDLDPRNVHERYQPALIALEAAGGGPEALDRVLAALESKDAKLSGEARLRLAPYALAPDLLKNPKADAWMTVLALFAPRHAPAAALDAESLRSPWTLLAAHLPAQLVLPRPDAAEHTATALEPLLERVPDEPTACVGDECPVQAALAMPRSALREAVRTLWMDVAAHHARSGARQRALDALEHVAALTPTRRAHQAAPILLAVGEAQRALTLLDADLPELRRHSPSTQVRILVNHALAHAHLGDLEAARTSAERAFTTAEEAQRGRRTGADSTFADVALDDAREAAAWLWAALSLATGRGADVHKRLADGAAPLPSLVAWLELAILPEAQRRPMRFNAELRQAPGPVLPAAMFLVGLAVPTESDVEVWLDRVFSHEHRSDAVRSMLARAEAARWRGDEGSERLWNDRVARIRALYDDYPSTLLAHLAELR